MESEKGSLVPWNKALLWALREVRAPGVLILLFLLGGFAVQNLRPNPGMMDPVFFWGSFVLFPVVGLYAVVLIVAWYRWRQRSLGEWLPGGGGWKRAWEDGERGTLGRNRLAFLAVVCLFLPLLLNTFGSWKIAIPMWSGFAWEADLLEVSSLMHGGAPAWHRLQPLLGHPAITVVLDRVYYTWLPVSLVLVLWQAVWREPAWERRRFLLALTLVWLGLGVVVATAGASAGPIFLDRILPSSGTFDPFFAYLAEVNQWTELMTLKGREVMWAAHEARGSNPTMGISAFPSVHVAMTALFVCALWGTGKGKVVLAISYMFLISLASIHMGWHYAVDAYVGALGAVACWILAGLWVRRFPGRVGGAAAAEGG